jgi:hypothetical protein
MCYDVYHVFTKCPHKVWGGIDQCDDFDPFQDRITCTTGLTERLSWNRGKCGKCSTNIFRRVRRRVANWFRTPKEKTDEWEVLTDVDDRGEGLFVP